MNEPRCIERLLINLVIVIDVIATIPHFIGQLKTHACCLFLRKPFGFLELLMRKLYACKGPALANELTSITMKRCLSCYRHPLYFLLLVMLQESYRIRKYGLLLLLKSASIEISNLHCRDCHVETRSFYSCWIFQLCKYLVSISSSVKLVPKT